MNVNIESKKNDCVILTLQAGSLLDDTMTLCYIIRTTPGFLPLSSFTSKQECIPVGCVAPARSRMRGSP